MDYSRDFMYLNTKVNKIDEVKHKAVVNSSVADSSRYISNGFKTKRIKGFACFDRLVSSVNLRFEPFKDVPSINSSFHCASYTTIYEYCNSILLVYKLVLVIKVYTFRIIFEICHCYKWSFIF